MEKFNGQDGSLPTQKLSYDVGVREYNNLESLAAESLLCVGQIHKKNKNEFINHPDEWRIVKLCNDAYEGNTNVCETSNEFGRGDVVRNAGAVLEKAATKLERVPNVNCRVESFGRMCASFDERRKQWVKEMGLSGLLHLQNKQLPRSLCYWLMTRVQPLNESFVSTDGKSYRLSTNQVSWVLGIPKGPKRVPKTAIEPHMNTMAETIQRKYGKEWEFQKKSSKKVVKCKGIHMSSTMLEGAEAEWDESEEYEFKTLFLLLSLHMVLCPTQGPRLAGDLRYALCCATSCREYDWCGLVLEKLMLSVRSFAKRFNSKGFTTGCGGCTIFLAIFYLDRLDRNPLQWGVFPRLKVWTMDEIRKASTDDRHSPKGDYGRVGCVDVAYGEEHMREARDRDRPEESEDDEKEACVRVPIPGKVRRKRSVDGIGWGRKVLRIQTKSDAVVVPVHNKLENGCKPHDI